MSDFVSHDMLPDLWDEILKLLWNYLETEESVQKIEERKKLENCLKEFLCIVPHDRKFFLPETAEVLKKTVLELENFTANKAISGFESLFQYASNLFTKPWRKEYRVLKMYSGFYQHEVQTNLLDAIKLFEAMGYRQLSEDILMLDGPICPDQVTNVSRDAMAAYVECQIMKQIYLGLEALNIDCTWQDVINYREKHVGGTSQAIKNLAYAIQEKRVRKEKNSTMDNFYSSVVHPPAATALAHYQNCASYTHAQQQPIYAPHNGHCAMHQGPSQQQQQQKAASCSMHPNANSSSYGYNNNNNNNKLIASYPAPTTAYMHPHHHQHHVSHPHMSHSRSLEQYNEPPPPLLPHRHSFDHQHQGCMSAHHYQQPNYPQMHVYETPYDCVDSTGSNASYAVVASSPYNVSGNRYPLPYSISSQLNAHYATPAAVTCNGIKGNDVYTTDNLYATVAKGGTCSYHHPQSQVPAPLATARYTAAAAASQASKNFHNYRQRSFPPDQHLIDFDDHAPLTAHDYHAQLHALTQNNSFDSSYETARQSRRSNNRILANYAQPRDLVCARATTPTACGNEVYDGYGYERAIPRGSRGKTALQTTDKYARNVQEALDNNCIRENEELNRRKSSDLLQTFDDYSLLQHDKVRASPTQAVKNQDGVGSFESWDYVYQNLEHVGYSKDLGERGDLLVQSLDLNALQLNVENNSGTAAGVVSGNEIAPIEKKRATELKAGRQNIEKLRTLDKSVKSAEERLDKDKSLTLKQNAPTTNGVMKKASVKSVLKTNITNNAISSAVAQNNNNEIIVAGKDVRRVPELSKRSPRNIQKMTTPATTQVIVSNPNEWSCRFCTYLNPDTMRVCEMCCRSKDLNLEATATHAPTCV